MAQAPRLLLKCAREKRQMLPSSTHGNWHCAFTCCTSWKDAHVRNNNLFGPEHRRNDADLQARSLFSLNVRSRAVFFLLYSWLLYSVISSDSDSVQMESCQLSCKWQPACPLHKIPQLMRWDNYVYPTPTTLPRASKLSIRERPRKEDFENPEGSILWMSTNIT